MTKKEKIKEVYKRLKILYGEQKIALNYSNPLELLIAVILSAQCTDKMVNKVTEKLFKKYRTIEDYCNCNIEEFKKDIKSIGLYNTKSKNILTTCKIIKQKYNRKVPSNMEELVELNGVGRKTANIILSTVYGINSGIAVDTHMLRLNYCLGLIKDRNDAKKGELELMKILDKKLWNKYTYLIIQHGRECCKTGRVGNNDCALKDLYEKFRG